jgi:radical SAM superfamily enzyme YgiQ (UPF0313 family)
MQLSAALKAAGHDARLACARTTPLAPIMNGYRPHLVGYSLCTGGHRRMLDLNLHMKRRWRFTSMLGGPHPTFFPEVVEEEGVDAICRGEGDRAMLEAAEAIDAGRPLAGIANLWARTPGGIARSGLRPLEADLDALPFPDREARYESDPRARDYPVKSFLVSRGCPFRCSYCFNSGYAELYGREWCRVRSRTVQNVIAEIEEVRASSRLEFVQFRESVFPWQPEWLEEFAAEYPRRVGLPFYCHVRADLLDERRVKLLSRAGCVSVNMGIECGDEKYRREVLGRPMSDEQIVGACRTLKSRGIRILADSMLGLPGAPDGTDWKTLRLNQRCGVDYALAMIFQPYPGTELGRRAEREGLFDGRLDGIAPSYYSRSPLRFADERRRREVENLQRLFAVLVEAPALERLARPLLRLQPGAALGSIFKAWYMYCYTRRIIPHRLARGELGELARRLLGVLPPEVNDELDQEGSGLAGPGRGDSAGAGGGALHPRLRTEGGGD